MTSVQPQLSQTDPEGNGIEIFTDTPWYVPQPHGVPIDLSRPKWRAEVRNRLERAI